MSDDVGLREDHRYAPTCLRGVTGYAEVAGGGLANLTEAAWRSGELLRRWSSALLPMLVNCANALLENSRSSEVAGLGINEPQAPTLGAVEQTVASKQLKYVFARNGVRSNDLLTFGWSEEESSSVVGHRAK